MTDRYHTPDDWTIEVVQLPEGERLRIRHHGYYIADVRSVPELERWIPSSELEYLERDTLILPSDRSAVPVRDLGPTVGAADSRLGAEAVVAGRPYAAGLRHQDIVEIEGARRPDDLRP